MAPHIPVNAARMCWIQTAFKFEYLFTLLILYLLNYQLNCTAECVFLDLWDRALQLKAMAVLWFSIAACDARVEIVCYTLEDEVYSTKDKCLLNMFSDVAQRRFDWKCSFLYL